MKIINKTNNAVIADEAVVANTPAKRMKGLLGRKELKDGQALILDPCNSIHTFFMLFPIDILFLDKTNKIIKSISCLKPFRLTAIYFNAASAVELPSGKIQSLSIKEGDIVSLES